MVFYMLPAFILGGGLMAVTTQKIFRAAIYLLFSLTGIAGLYFWMQYEFLAAVQIIVYVGGIVVLIIFSIFLTQTSGMDMPAALKSRKLFAALAVICGFLTYRYTDFKTWLCSFRSKAVDSGCEINWT